MGPPRDGKTKSEEFDVVTCGNFNQSTCQYTKDLVFLRNHSAASVGKSRKAASSATHLMATCDESGRGTTGTARLSKNRIGLEKGTPHRKNHSESGFQHASAKAHQFKNVLLSFEYALQCSTDDTFQMSSGFELLNSCHVQEGPLH